jgi:hypothetical protein
MNRTLLVCSVALALGVGACHHHAPLGPHDDAGSPADGGAGTGGSSGTTGTAGAGGTAGAAGAGGAAGSTGGTGGVAVTGDGTSVGIRRLSDVEYANTLRDLFGAPVVTGPILATLSATADAAVTGPGWTVGALDNLAGRPGISAARYQAYFDTASSTVDLVFSSDVARPKVVTCSPATPADDDACARAIIRAFGQRAWRRPLTDAEVADLAKLSATLTAAGATFVESMRGVVVALLASETFLYRIELDVPVASTTSHPLTPFELATRLSYLLWSSTPDDALLQLAASGELAKREVLAAQAKRLLDDPRGAGFVRDFFGQWLGFRVMDGTPLDRTPYPWSPALQAAMLGEAQMLLGELVRDDHPLGDLFALDVNYVNYTLASLYGMNQAAIPAELTRVVAPTDTRKGFLGTGAFLTMTSHQAETSPTWRGMWVVERLYCQPIPPPPGNHPATAAGATPRAVANTIASMPACNACHSLFDRIGLGLEGFDAIGRARTAYPGAAPIPVDDSGTLPPGTPFNGELGLADLLAKDERISACASRAALSYAVGRSFAADDATVARFARDWGGAKLGLRALVTAIVGDDAFKNRRGEGAP